MPPKKIPRKSRYSQSGAKHLEYVRHGTKPGSLSSANKSQNHRIPDSAIRDVASSAKLTPKLMKAVTNSLMRLSPKLRSKLTGL